MIDFEDKLPKAYHLYSMLFARINSSLNPILYGLTNPLFQRGFKNFFNFIFCRKEYSYVKVKSTSSSIKSSNNIVKNYVVKV